jgi:dihydrofolate reductase
MGILTVEQIVTADGFAAAPDGGLAFFEAADFGDQSRIDSEQLTWLAGVDAILLGRRTYEMFAGYWPQADPSVEAVAEPIARLPKHVVSNTLSRAPWGDGEISVLSGDGVRAVRDLKERFASIVVWGSLELAGSLFTAGLVDVLRLRVVPVLIGDGLRIAPAGLGQRPLALRRVDRHDTGHVLLEYEVRPE